MEEMIEVPKRLLEQLMNAATSESYCSEEDEIGEFVCCRELSYRGHSSDCPYRLMKDWIEKQK